MGIHVAEWDHSKWFSERVGRAHAEMGPVRALCVVLQVSHSVHNLVVWVWGLCSLSTWHGACTSLLWPPRGAWPAPPSPLARVQAKESSSPALACDGAGKGQ
jgi:hypothetical protein